jgi:hypothetical protein
MLRRIVSLVRAAKGEKKIDQTLERLKLRRQKLREQLSARKADALASKRYEGSEKYQGDLPVAEAAQKPKPKPQKKPEEPTPAKAAEQISHIDRLLKAKQKAAERKDNENSAGNE